MMLGVFATAFAPFVGSDQRNFLVIALAALAIPLMGVCRVPLGRDLFLPSALYLYMVLVTLVVGDASDVSSVGFTGMFIVSYIALSGAVGTGLVPRYQVEVLLRWLILAFCAVSILQAVTSLVGLPIPNLILSKGLWSYNSLAVEPSQAGRILAVTLLAYLNLARLGGRATNSIGLLRREKLLIVAFAVSTILSGSTLALIAAPLAIILSFSARWIMLASGALIFSLPLLHVIDAPALQRGLGFLGALPSMEIGTIVDADQSGALRVLPSLLYLEKFQVDQVAFWFGGGLGAVNGYVQGELPGADNLVTAGFIPGFLISFGLLGVTLFLWAFIGRFLSLVTAPLVVLWVLLLSTSAWNTQVFWYGLMLLRVVYHYQVIEPALSSRLAASAQGEEQL